jgi:hypothetical protein
MQHCLPASSIFNNARFDIEIITPIPNQYQIFSSQNKIKIQKRHKNGKKRL